MSKKEIAKTIFWILFIIGYFVTSIITGDWFKYIELWGAGLMLFMFYLPMIVFVLVIFNALCEIGKNLK